MNHSFDVESRPIYIGAIVELVNFKTGKVIEIDQKGMYTIQYKNGEIDGWYSPGECWVNENPSIPIEDLVKCYYPLPCPKCEFSGNCQMEKEGLKHE